MCKTKPQNQVVRVCRGNYRYKDQRGSSIATIRKVDTDIWWASTLGESGHFDSLPGCQGIRQADVD